MSYPMRLIYITRLKKTEPSLVSFTSPAFQYKQLRVGLQAYYFSAPTLTREATKKYIVLIYSHISCKCTGGSYRVVSRLGTSERVDLGSALPDTVPLFCSPARNGSRVNSGATPCCPVAPHFCTARYLLSSPLPHLALTQTLAVCSLNSWFSIHPTCSQHAALYHSQ